MISAAVCDSFKEELLSGIHAAGDSYKIALYLAAASLGPTTETYDSANEVAGDGYIAGGQVLVGFATGRDGNISWIDFTTNPSWDPSAITARGALIYNASKANRALAVLDFTENKTSSNGEFTINFPVPDADTALIRIT